MERNTLIWGVFVILALVTFWVGYCKFKNCFTLRLEAKKQDSLLNYGPFWLSGFTFLWLALVSFAATIVFHAITPEVNLSFDLSRNGWESAISLFKFPLGCLAAAAAAMGITATIFRSSQTLLQIQISEKTANVSYYYATMKSFTEYVESISKSYDWHNTSPHKLFNLLFKTDEHYNLEVQTDNCLMLYRNMCMNIQQCIEAINNKDEFKFYIALSQFNLTEYLGGTIIGNIENTESIIFEDTRSYRGLTIELPKTYWLLPKEKAFNLLKRILQFSILAHIDIDTKAKQDFEPLANVDSSWLLSELREAYNNHKGWVDECIFQTKTQGNTKVISSKSGTDITIRYKNAITIQMY